MSGRRRPSEAAPPARRRRVRRPVVAAAVAIALGAAAAVAASRHAAPVGRSLARAAASLLAGGRSENILLIGNNARDAATPTAPGMADLLYVVHTDPARREVVVISVPRDTMVAFPGWNDPIPKIKSALLMGGPQLEMQAVSRLIGMPIQGYVEADFAGFAAAIDDVGGVWIRVPARLYDPTYSHADFAPGYQHMDGAQALAYVRIRQNEAGNGYRVNAFQRQSAGLQVMEALKNQVLRHATPSRLMRLAGVLRTDFATDLSTGQLVSLLALADEAHIRSVSLGHLADTMVIDSTALPGVNAEGRIIGAYYDILTPQGIEAALRPYGARHPQTGLPPLPPPGEVTAAVSDTPEGQAYAARLRAQGLRVTMGGAPASAGGLLVLYPPGELPAAEVVGRALGNTNEVLREAPVPGIEVEAP
ncbi:MAG: LCP family protein [Firmicutes bacterium]|nr:LCP family protein [Bacillota bacterium]